MKKQIIPTFGHLISFKHLLRSWQIFKTGKEHKRDVAGVAAQIITVLGTLARDLKEKRYVHGPYAHFVISDPKRRDIHKASVRDRIVHHALYTVLYSYFDERFIYDSYSCRNTKGTHRALDRYDAMARKASRNYTRTLWVLKCDIRKFFASIDHEVLKKILAVHISDENIKTLLSHIIDSFHTAGREGKGLPLGNLTSQLLVNVYMNEFDHFVKHTQGERYYIRYADDFVIMHQNKRYLETLLSKLSDFLEKRLNLSLHPDKVFIKTFASGVDFLGWVHFPTHRVLRTSTRRRMMRVLHEKSSKATTDSYLGMLSHGNTYKIASSIIYAQKRERENN